MDLSLRFPVALIMSTVSLYLRMRSIGFISFKSLKRWGVKCYHILLRIEWFERNVGFSTVNLLSFEILIFVERLQSKGFYASKLS